MANVSYGMGQYRYDPSKDYITLFQKFDGKNPSTDRNFGHQDIEYFRNNNGGINYRDILLTCLAPSGTNKNNHIIQYGTTYYVELTLPQHREYQMRVNLKLCAGDSEKVDTARFQNIKTLIIPPTPKSDSIFSDVLLFEDPRDASVNPVIRAAVIDEDHIVQQYSKISDKINNNNHHIHDVYYCSTGEEDVVGYYFIDNNNNIIKLDRGHYSSKLNPVKQDWKLNEATGEEEINSTVTFKFAFSPKYNLAGGYTFLLLETERDNIESHTIEYIDNKVTYYGTYLDIEKIKVNMYTVANLLFGGSQGSSWIQAGTDQLIHIGVWGHPEQILTINGEEIKIGQSGFYELKDFTINNLGVIVNKIGEGENAINDINDRFTIDYEYRIITT